MSTTKARQRARRAEVGPEAQSWIAAVEDAVTAKGLPLEGIRARMCEGLGCALVFYGRARANGDPRAADLLACCGDMADLVGLTLEELAALRPAGVA